jgi:hypothetical protein
MKKIRLTLFVISLLLLPFVSQAQAPKKDKLDELRINLLFGLNQPLIGGFNVEGNLLYKRFIFDYSHGVSLNLDNALLDEVNQAQGLDVHIPWTTGFGLGYRFNQWFNLRVEPKWHQFELYEQGASQIPANLIGSYRTFSLGLGAYANLRPFKNHDNFLQGIMLAPSIRWWPRMSSSLPGDELTYFNRQLEQSVTHEAMEVGLSNTPLVVNISIGYSFGLKK